MKLNKPLLLIDIDGVISLFGFDPGRAPGGQFVSVDGIIHFLSASAGDRIRRLGDAFEPIWCSGWEEKANEYLPQALGLPGPFPFLTFERAIGRSDAHWKLDAIDRFSGRRRPLAWLDDAFDRSCDAWAAARPAPTLLVGTEPAIGLTEAHVEGLLRWASGLVADRA
jgi:hypothetical protein